MKIVMADPSLFTGRYDDSLCAALAARGHEVKLLARPMRPSDAIRPKRYAYWPRFFRFGEVLRAMLGDSAPVRAAKAVEYAFDAMIGPLGAFGHEVVHFQWLPFARADKRLLARLGARTALVHTVHNAKAYHDDGAAQGRGYLDLLPMFDALIVHGQGTLEALGAHGIPTERIHVVPHPPMQLAEATPSDIAAVPRPAAPRILLFGTIRPYKGLDLLVDAALALWGEGLDFEIAIAGKPFFDVAPLFDRIRAAGFGHRLVTELGFLTEGRLDAHLRAADIMAFPYRAIDSSGAFLTALGYGAAMVTSDAGMFGELEDGAVARFPVGDADALAERLRPLIADSGRRAQLGDAARAVHDAMGDWASAAAATEQVYEAAKTHFAARKSAA